MWFKWFFWIHYIQYNVKRSVDVMPMLYLFCVTCLTWLSTVARYCLRCRRQLRYASKIIVLSPEQIEHDLNNCLQSVSWKIVKIFKSYQPYEKLHDEVFSLPDGCFPKLQRPDKYQRLMKFSVLRHLQHQFHNQVVLYKLWWKIFQSTI